jgi:hypothetical protein
MKHEFSQQSVEKIVGNFIKILSVGAELFHADGWQTDRHAEAVSRFSQFCEHTQKSIHSYLH